MNKILIIDDSPMILNIGKDIIEKNLINTRVEVEEDPKKGMDRLQTEEFHVLILDIVMPKMSGIEVLKAIKVNKKLNNLKVIMFTSIDDSEALADCFKLGAYDFISKPLEKNEFLARISHGINEYRQASIIQKNFHEMAIKNIQLEELNKTLKDTQSELVQTEKLAGIGYLAAGMAHEINNPLGYVKSNITTVKTSIADIIDIYEKLKKEVLEDNYLKYRSMIDELETEVSYDFLLEDFDDIFYDVQQGLNRISDITTSLRSFSQEENSNKKELIDVNHAIANILSLTKTKFKDRVVVKTELDVMDEVFCNKGDFNLSLMSIITNSFESIEKLDTIMNGKLNIRTFEEEDEIIIEIEDNGVGMEEEILKHAVDPFFTTKDVGDGAGLGLSTAYNCFVNVMKGLMKIESKPGLGTKVTIKLPIER